MVSQLVERRRSDGVPASWSFRSSPVFSRPGSSSTSPRLVDPNRATSNFRSIESDAIGQRASPNSDRSFSPPQRPAEPVSEHQDHERHSSDPLSLSLGTPALQPILENRAESLNQPLLPTAETGVDEQPKSEDAPPSSRLDQLNNDLRRGLGIGIESISSSDEQSQPHAPTVAQNLSSRTGSESPDPSRSYHVRRRSSGFQRRELQLGSASNGAAASSSRRDSSQMVRQLSPRLMRMRSDGKYWTDQTSVTAPDSIEMRQRPGSIDSFSIRPSTAGHVSLRDSLTSDEQHIPVAARSGSTFELVPWQVATNAASQSEDIFRPHSLSVTEDFAVPPTPLKGASGFDDATAAAADGDEQEENTRGSPVISRRGQADSHGASLIGLGIDMPRACRDLGMELPESLFGPRAQDQPAAVARLIDALGQETESHTDRSAPQSQGPQLAQLHSQIFSTEDTALRRMTSNSIEGAGSSQDVMMAHGLSKTAAQQTGPIANLFPDEQSAALADSLRVPQSPALRGQEAARSGPLEEEKQTRRPSMTLWLITLVFSVLWQALFFVFLSAYLWYTISPAVSIVAAVLSALVDICLLARRYPVLLLVLSATTTAYMMSFCAVQLAQMASDPARGANAPGIHLDPSRSFARPALQEVVRDVPLTAVVFLGGAIAAPLQVIVAAYTVTVAAR